MSRDRQHKRQENKCEPRIACRSNCLFIAGIVSVIAGLLFPMSAHILDVLLIFSISLTTAALIITFSAHGVREISGFPLLIVTATTLRVTLCVACVKLILLQGSAGTIVGIFGGFVSSGSPALTTSVLGVVTMVILGTVCKTVRGIRQVSIEFRNDIVPLRQVSIENDLAAGAISHSEAAALQARTACETKFFASMDSTAKFMLCDAAIEFVVVGVGVLASIAMGVAASASAETPAKAYGSLAAGAGMFTQISVLLTAVACGHLVRKSCNDLAFDAAAAEPRQKAAEAVTIVSNNAPPPQTVELHYGKTIIPIRDIAMVESRFIESESTEIGCPAATTTVEADDNEIAEDIKRYHGSERTCREENDSGSLWDSGRIKDSRCYESVAEFIESKAGKGLKTILMAAENVDGLPVTVPVNVAMYLAQKNGRCLLVDLDSERNAIAKVFDLDRNGQQVCDPERPGLYLELATCIDGLWVWPASNLSEGNFGRGSSDFENLIAELERRYDCLVIYSPNTSWTAFCGNDRLQEGRETDSSQINWEQAAGQVQMAMLFGSQESENSDSRMRGFISLLTRRGCKILKPMEVCAEAI